MRRAGARQRGDRQARRHPDDLGRLGYKGLAPDLLIRMRDHGVTASFIRRAQEQGYRNAPPEELIRLRSRGIVRD